MGESRGELLQWLNSLLQLNVTKVEQCGTGAALCQVFDSIFLDVAMSKVKFNVTGEYAYIQNFKVLQNCFTKHGIERSIPIESLVKCKMQDNLEFLQWSKRYWDQYFPGIEYDPVARRKASGPVGGAVSSTPTARGPAAPAARRPLAGSTARGTPRTGSALGGAGGAANSAIVSNLTAQNNELKENVAGLERERDFYFNKLREIEDMLSAEVEAHPELEQEEGHLINRMQAVLYSTEEGFEIPTEDGLVEGVDGIALAHEQEEETF